MKQKERMKENSKWWSANDAAERGALSQKGRVDEAREEGREEGIAEGRADGILEGRISIAHQLIMAKYQVDATSLLKSLAKDQLNQMALLVLSCDSFEELKKSLI